MKTTRIERRYANPLQFLLLWLTLFLLAPAAYAHQGHHSHHDGARSEPAAHSHHVHYPQHEGRRSELALTGDISASAPPCGGHGGTYCCCENTYCLSPDFAKLPGIPQTGYFLPSPHQPSLPALAAGRPAWAPSPIVALAAPRAPPLPL